MKRVLLLVHPSEILREEYIRERFNDYRGRPRAKCAAPKFIRDPERACWHQPGNGCKIVGSIRGHDTILDKSAKKYQV